MSTQLATSEAEIISAITSIPATIPPGTGYGEWTAAIKRSLTALGRAKDYNVCPSGPPDECEREWLYDLVWYRSESPHLREIGLVLESEWSKDPYEIRYDFEKLLVAKSPYKVMVFQDSKDNLPELWTLFETGIRTFQAKPAGEKYILVAYENAKGAFTVKTVTA